MSAKNSVVQKVVYAKDSPTEAEKNANVVYRSEGTLSKPELVNREIEDAEVREGIPRGDGKISISIEPGDELGDLSLNVQFEGKRGDYDFCMENHNQLLLHVSEWMNEFLKELDSDFEFILESKPCTETTQRVELDLAAQILQGNKSLKQSLSVKNDIKHSVIIENRVEKKIKHD